MVETPLVLKRLVLGLNLGYAFFFYIFRFNFTKNSNFDLKISAEINPKIPVTWSIARLRKFFPTGSFFPDLN